MHYVVYDYIGVAHIFNMPCVTFQISEPNMQVYCLAPLLSIIRFRVKTSSRKLDIRRAFFALFLQEDTSY